MKRLTTLVNAVAAGTAACLAFAVLNARAQTLTGGDAAATSPPDASAPQVLARDACSTVKQFVEFLTNTVTGEVSSRLHRYTEVGSALNYFDTATGQFLPSQDLIEIMSDGSAAALHGPTLLHCAPNINTYGAILTANSTNVLRTHILGLFYCDTSTGSNLCLSTLQDSVGEIVSPNRPTAHRRHSLCYYRGGAKRLIVCRFWPGGEHTILLSSAGRQLRRFLGLLVRSGRHNPLVRDLHAFGSSEGLAQG